MAKQILASDHKIELLGVGDLLPYARNARTHDEAQVAQIAASIKEFGFTNPVLVGDDNTIIAGHGRVEGARKLGMERVPCIRLSHLTEAQRKAYVIADNRLALNAGWDTPMLSAELEDLDSLNFDLSLLGFEDNELEDLLNPDQEPGEGLTDDDEVPEAPVEPVTRSGDLWILGSHRVLCGDATNVEHVERLMAGEKADLWLTDPPYGVAYKGKTKDSLEIKNDAMPLEDMAEFWTALATSALIATTERAPYYWFACQGGDQMMMMSIGRAGWKVRHELIWVKDQFVMSRCDYHYKHEPILYGWKQDGTHEYYGDRSQTSVLEFAKPKRNDVHPTMKPVGLIEYLLGNSSKPGGKVFDTCLGSGSTLIACEKTNRRCYGMEIDPQYCDVIVKRWQDYTGQKATLEETGQTFDELKEERDAG